MILRYVTDEMVREGLRHWHDGEPVAVNAAEHRRMERVLRSVVPLMLRQLAERIAEQTEKIDVLRGGKR